MMTLTVNTALLNFADLVRLFLLLIVPCFLGSFLAIIVAEMMKTGTLFGSRLRRFINEIHYASFQLMKEGMTDEQIINKLRRKKFSFLLLEDQVSKTGSTSGLLNIFQKCNRDKTDAAKDSGQPQAKTLTNRAKKLTRDIAFAKIVLGNNQLIKDYMLDPYFDKKGFKELQRKVAPLLKTVVKKDAKEELTAKVRSILVDTRQENVQRMEGLLVEWHRRPSVFDEIIGSDSNDAMYVTYLFESLKSLHIVKDSTSYDKYAKCLKDLNDQYDKMSIVKSKSSISRGYILNNTKINDMVTAKMSEILSGKQEDKETVS